MGNHRNKALISSIPSALLLNRQQSELFYMWHSPMIGRLFKNNTKSIFSPKFWTSQHKEDLAKKVTQRSTYEISEKFSLTCRRSITITEISSSSRPRSFDTFYNNENHQISQRKFRECFVNSLVRIDVKEWWVNHLPWNYQGTRYSLCSVSLRS